MYLRLDSELRQHRLLQRRGYKSTTMNLKIAESKKWIVLAILLLAFYITASLIWAVIRIKFPSSDETQLTEGRTIISCFLRLSPNLLLFAYFVWRIYHNNISRKEQQVLEGVSDVLKTPSFYLLFNKASKCFIKFSYFTIIPTQRFKTQCQFGPRLRSHAEIKSQIKINGEYCRAQRIPQRKSRIL